MIGGLLEQWRADAQALRRRNCLTQAEMLEQLIQEAAEYEMVESERTVTVAHAAQMGGYSESQIRRMLRQGTIPNSGRVGAPRIAVKDIPYKAGARSDAGHYVGRVQIVRSAIDEE